MSIKAIRTSVIPLVKNICNLTDFELFEDIQYFSSRFLLEYFEDFFIY